MVLLLPQCFPCLLLFPAFFLPHLPCLFHGIYVWYLLLNEWFINGSLWVILCTAVYGQIWSLQPVGSTLTLNNNNTDLFLSTEKCNWKILWRGEAFVSCREEEGLCVWSVSDHSWKVYQHVCCFGWAEKYEVQREEWPFGLQTVRCSVGMWGRGAAFSIVGLCCYCESCQLVQSFSIVFAVLSLQRLC